MDKAALEIALADEAATQRFGEDMSLAIGPGDVIRLEGDLGAGKSTLARALIRAMADAPDLEVPSPTFTLVQSYDLRIPVHHIDLYRLAGPDEADELGMDELAASGAVLVEWPERAGDRLPEAALTVRLDHAGSGRRATVFGRSGAVARLERSLSIRSFLDEAGWGQGHRRFLLGDASTRSYETVETDGGTRILMNAPKQPDGPPIRDGKPYSQIAHLAESVLPFVAIDEVLRAEGFCAPEIHAADIDSGLLLIEHLGSVSYLSPEGRPVRERCEEAARLLAAMHAKTWPERIRTRDGREHVVPHYDRGAMMIEVELVTDWYMPFATGRHPDASVREGFVGAWNAVFDRLEKAETSLVLRDYHSPNLIWREEERGLDRLGLIDFQDAMIGPAAYDMASLAMDARVTIPADLERSMVETYAQARAEAGRFDRAAFEESYAIMAAQRNSKILGIFVRLDRRDGKPQYLKHLPRIRAYLGRALEHPSLAPVARFYRHHRLLEEAAA